MSSRLKSSVRSVLRRRSRRRDCLRRPSRPHLCRARRSSVHGERACSRVSDKLEALKNLIPSHNGELKADRLFQETADYIVLLRTQVAILQRLIEFYGSSETENAV